MSPAIGTLSEPAPGSAVPASIEIIYQPSAHGWIGSCPTLPGPSAEAASFLAVDLALGPVLSRALEARHGQALLVSVTPDDAEPLGDGRHHRRLRVTPAYTPCTLQFSEALPRR